MTGALFKVQPYRPTLACLLLLTACASSPDSSRLSMHACSLNPGEPQYPDACTQTAPEYYSLGAYGYYPPLLIPVIVPPAPPVKPPSPPPPKPAPRQEPVHHCPINADRACP